MPQRIRRYNVGAKVAKLANELEGCLQRVEEAARLDIEEVRKEADRRVQAEVEKVEKLEKRISELTRANQRLTLNQIEFEKAIRKLKGDTALRDWEHPIYIPDDEKEILLVDLWRKEYERSLRDTFIPLEEKAKIISRENTKIIMETYFKYCPYTTLKDVVKAAAWARSEPDIPEIQELKNLPKPHEMIGVDPEGNFTHGLRLSCWHEFNEGVIKARVTTYPSCWFLTDPELKGVRLPIS